MIAQVVMLVQVDMGTGSRAWVDGRPELHECTIALFKELGEAKADQDAGR